MRDRYPEYRIMAPADKGRLFEDGTISFDTNCLLALYRQSESGADQLIQIINLIKDRLWEPDHVIYEFMKNRPNVIYGNTGNGEKAYSILGEFKQNFEIKLSQYINRVVIDPVEKQAYKDDVLAKIAELEESLSSIETAPQRDVADETILGRIEAILDGRIGEPATEDEMVAWEKEFKERAARLVPPGYKDAGKNENGAGDLVIWKQLLKAKCAQKFPHGLVFVTADLKEDMYWRVKGRTLGPRPELIAEFAKCAPAGVPYWQVSLAEFVKWASESLSVSVDDVQIDESEVSRIARSLPYGAWEPDSYNELLEELEANNYINQLRTVIRAARNGGFIERSEVYEICEFDEPRRLNGFSQPVTRICKNLFSANGESDEQLAPPIRARYSGPGKTIGYEVPAEFTFFAWDNVAAWIDWGNEGPDYLNDEEFVGFAER